MSWVSTRKKAAVRLRSSKTLILADLGEKAAGEYDFKFFVMESGEIDLQPPSLPGGLP